MDFTFGVVSNGENQTFINKVIDSIENENIPNYEIIVVGNVKIERNNTIVIPFDESIKNGWITKKKNIITNNSKYDNVVFLHDYIVLTSGWYLGHTSLGDNYDIRMDRILNYDGLRFRDWCIWPHNKNLMDDVIGRECIIPYTFNHLKKYQYISGSYWVAKKDIMLKYPLDETLSWGESEDVEWSFRVRENCDIQMNTNSSVQFLKQKDKVFNYSTETTNNKLINLFK
jgi:hypothetical protein